MLIIFAQQTQGTIVCAAEALHPVTCGAEGAAAPLGSLEVQQENSGLYWQAMKRICLCVLTSLHVEQLESL